MNVCRVALPPPFVFRKKGTSVKNYFLMETQLFSGIFVPPPTQVFLILSQSDEKSVWKKNVFNLFL